MGPPPTPVPDPCFSNDYKNCLPPSFPNELTSCTTVLLPNGPRNNCNALWEECADSSDCCGDAVCFEGANRATCVPPGDSTRLLHRPMPRRLLRRALPPSLRLL